MTLRAPSRWRARLPLGLVLVALLSLAACTSSHFETPQVQGSPAMVDDGGKPRLWALSKQEEQREVSVGGGGRHNTPYLRTDTFFHFQVQAFDPIAAKPLWKRRLLTLGDPAAKGTGPSRVVGSAVDARLLGQDGALVWLLIGDAPFAVNASDGNIVVDGARLQQINPELKGLLPSEAKHYGFDRGLVLMAADARQFVVRGPAHKAIAWTPPAPPAEPEGPLQANGTHELVPLMPLGDVQVRQVTLAGQWLGLYSEKEAADASNDDWGRNLRYPYRILNEGSLARRTFWRAKIVDAQRFDEKFQRLSELTPIAGSPVFLKGRFQTDGFSGQALVLDAPASVLVWHSTRIDDAGHLALARLGADLKPLWDTELPLSETDVVRHIQTWRLPGYFVVIGELQSEDDGGVTSRAPYLVSVDLKTGALNSRNLTAEEDTQ